MICQQDNTDPTRRPHPALLIVALALCGSVGCVCLHYTRLTAHNRFSLTPTNPPAYHAL